MNDEKTPVLGKGWISTWDLNAAGTFGRGNGITIYHTEGESFLDRGDKEVPVELVPAGTTEKLMTALEKIIRLYHKWDDYAVCTIERAYAHAEKLQAALRGESEAKHE